MGANRFATVLVGVLLVAAAGCREKVGPMPQIHFGGGADTGTSWSLARFSPEYRRPNFLGVVVTRGPGVSAIAPLEEVTAGATTRLNEAHIDARPQSDPKETPVVHVHLTSWKPSEAGSVLLSGGFVHGEATAVVDVVGEDGVELLHGELVQRLGATEDGQKDAGKRLGRAVAAAIADGSAH